MWIPNLHRGPQPSGFTKWGSGAADDDETKEIKLSEIEEFPDKCNLCGNPAYLGFQNYVCSNHFCKNFKNPLKG